MSAGREWLFGMRLFPTSTRTPRLQRGGQEVKGNPRAQGTLEAFGDNGIVAIVYDESDNLGNAGFCILGQLIPRVRFTDKQDGLDL
ncbi:hypothetical protein EMCRGX_G006270 [Ephydatia muelleri]